LSDSLDLEKGEPQTAFNNQVANAYVTCSRYRQSWPVILQTLSEITSSIISCAVKEIEQVIQIVC
jgi:hypothetical protein